MNNRIYFLLIFIIAGVASCNSEGNSSEEKKNLEVARSIAQAFDNGDISKVDELVAPDFVDHTDRGDMNRDSLKAMVSMVKKQFPDMKSDVIREFAEGDQVIQVMRYHGTSNGQMGMPIGPYDMNAVHRTRFKDGKAVEHWEYMEMRDMVKMMQQMGPAVGDTAVK